MYVYMYIIHVHVQMYVMYIVHNITGFACAWHVICPLPVTPAQLMMPDIGRNASCASGDFHFYI